MDYFFKGFYVYISLFKGKIYIDFYVNVSIKYYVVYYVKDVYIDLVDMFVMSCGVCYFGFRN